MALTFPSTLPRYHRSGLSFVARDGNRTIEFWMTARAFGERFGHRNFDTGKAIGTFERNRNAIERVANDVYDGRPRTERRRRLFVITAARFNKAGSLPHVAIDED